LRKRIEELTGKNAAGADAADARIEKLELLTEHPDVTSATCESTAFASPAVSVVMPTWNREAVIGAAIRSVQAQTFADWELLVIDDGSADGTRQVMEAFAADHRIRYAAQGHAGQCAARNHALRLAKGVMVAYLDSDNVWYPEFLSAAVAAFSTMPDVDCAYGAMIRDPMPDRSRILFERFDRRRLLGGNFIGMSTFVHRRSLVDRFGGFDETLQGFEDWDLVLRYTAHAPAYRLPVRAVRYRVMDERRVTVVQDLEKARAIIKSKWRGT
jgi:glycosyltransferase involved in cell wall biosynthesis